jgi:hypothetical protein
MSDQIRVEENTQRRARKKDNTELWISRGYAEHMITIVHENGKPDVVRFKDYKFECDLSNDMGRSISKGLRECGREGRDIFVVGRPYAENDIANRTDMLRKLRGMTITQLRAMLTLDELIECGVPVNTVDSDALITVIMKTKSI